MKIEVKSNIQEVIAALDKYKSEVVSKAIPRALNRTAEMTVTALARAARGEGFTASSSSEIKQAITVYKANETRRTVTLRISRKVKSLMYFSPLQLKDGVSVKVYATRKTINGAFIAQLTSGREGVFVEDKSAGRVVVRVRPYYEDLSKGKIKPRRVSSANRQAKSRHYQSYRARELFGPSIGGVLGSKRHQEATLLFIKRTFSERLKHEIEFLSKKT